MISLHKWCDNEQISLCVHLVDCSLSGVSILPLTLYPIQSSNLIRILACNKVASGSAKEKGKSVSIYEFVMQQVEGELLLYIDSLFQNTILPF